MTINELHEANRGKSSLSYEELAEISDKLTNDHYEAGYVVLMGTDSLAEVCQQENIEIDQQQAEEWNEEFLRLCGFDEFGSPPSFYYGGNGDCYFLTSLKLEDLKQWVSEKLS